MSNALDHSFEIISCKLLKYSLRRDTIFLKLKEEMTPGVPGLCSFCPTRWTVRGASVEASNWTTIPFRLPGKKQSPSTKLKGQGPNQWCCSHHADFQLSDWSNVGWTNSQVHWQPEPYPSSYITICSRGTFYITIVCLCPSRHEDRVKFQPALGLGPIHTEVPRCEWHT